MRQLVYISTIRSAAREDGLVPTLLSVSRRNNRRDGVTGLLFFNGKRFLQVIEGEAAIIERTFARIKDDARHHAMVALSDRMVTRREFGDWAMAEGSMTGAGEKTLEQVRQLAAGAAPDIRAMFESYAALVAYPYAGTRTAA